MTDSAWSDAARRVLDRVELSAVRIESAQMRSRPASDDDEMQVGTTVSISMKQQSGGLVLRGTYATEAVTKDESESVWRVDVVVAALYTGQDLPEFSADERKAFSFAVGLMAVHPYARQFTQSAVVQMGYPAFTIELMRAPGPEVLAGEDGQDQPDQD